MSFINTFKVLKMTGCLLLTVSMIFCCTACGEKTVKNDYRIINSTLFETQELASNGNFTLSWDNSASAVLLTSEKTGKVWSNILYDAYKKGDDSVSATSSLDITVANAKTLKWATVKCNTEIPANGRILCKPIDNGIRITYFFDKYKIAVPVEYVLRSDSVSVSVNTAQILENGEDYKLVSVSVAPFLCSVENNTENGYIMIPAGSGAIMKSTVTAEGIRKFTGEVLGEDASRQVPKDFTDDESIRLPVFGSTDGETAMIGIIENGVGSSEITAQSGNERLGYANAAVNFYVRGYDKFAFQSHGTGNGVTVRISENITGNLCSVAFYPLLGGKADYFAMAERYRKYLVDSKTLTKSEVNSSPYAVTLLGGTRITKSFFGIPYQEIRALTTFSEAKNILKDLKKSVGVTPVVRMYGFGDTGIFPGQINGGKDYPAVYGSKSEIGELSDYLKKEKSNLFFDYETVNFSKSGNGFSVRTDVSQTAINKKIVRYPLDSIRMDIKNSKYYILSRNSLNKATQKAEKKAENCGVNGIAYSSLGSTAFSDFAYSQYQNKADMEKDVIKAFDSAKKNGFFIASSDANYYAAGKADVLFDTSASNGNYNAFDVCVPFYQTVFHEYKPMYGSPVNLASNGKKAFAVAVAYGMGISFTLTDRYISDSDDLDIYSLYGTVYSDNKELINECISKSGYTELYKMIKEDRITDYQISEDLVSCTKYASGIAVYVNQSDRTVNSPAGKLEPYTFKAFKGGDN